MPSKISTRRRLEYARGYLQLGLLAEARAEVEAIAEDDQNDVAVLECRVDLHMETKEWERVVSSAEPVCAANPGCERAWIGWAFALRELQRIVEARDVLLRAEEHHPECSVLHYNLACYFCLLGDMSEADERLVRACEMDENWHAVALQDPDLRCMRSRLASRD